MKRILCVLLCLAVCFGCSLTAFAGGSIPAQDMIGAADQAEPAAVTALPSGLSVGKLYNIRSMASERAYPFMLNVWGGIDNDKTRVDMWLRDATTAQRFSIIVSGSYYKLRALCSSTRVLDAYRNSDGSITSCCQADIWSNNDDAAQQLIIEGSSTSGYTICLASNPSLALTAVNLSNDGAVQFKTKTGANNQKWCFDEAVPLLTRYPDYYCQNKNNWCWAAAAKIVGIHNGGGLNPAIDPNAQKLDNNDSLHNSYYGYNGSERYADGVQHAIVKTVYYTSTDPEEEVTPEDCIGTDKDRRGTAWETRDALQYVSKNNMSVGWRNNNGNQLIDDMISQLNYDLEHSKFVAGRMATLDNKDGHIIVVKSHNDDGSYTVFNPWNNEEKSVSARQLIYDGGYKYLTTTTGRMNAFYYCH